MTAQKKAEIKLWALTLIGSLSLAASGGLFGRTVKIFTIFFILEAGVVAGWFFWNDLYTTWILKWRP